MSDLTKFLKFKIIYYFIERRRNRVKKNVAHPFDTHLSRNKDFFPVLAA